MKIDYLIKKYQKELDFSNHRLNDSIFIGSNNKLIVKTEISVYEQVISDLRAFKIENKK